jgi:hypothetical protein
MSIYSFIESDEIRWQIGYTLIILIGVYRLFTETVTFSNQLFDLFINQNYAIPVYILISIIIMWAIFRDSLSVREYISANTLFLVSVTGIIVLAFSFVFLGTIPAIDQASDHDEATEAWNDALLSGENPYDCANHSDYSVCQLTVLPGLALLALPAFLLGEVAILGALSIVVIIYVFYYISSNVETQIYALFSLGISVPFSFRLLSQSNYFEIIALFLIGFLFLKKERLLLSGSIFGIVFATKTNIWPILPVVAFHVYRTKQIRRFGRFIIPAVAVGTLLHLPFFLWDPNIFLNEAPLGVASGHVSSRLSIPHASVLLPVLVVSVSIITEYYTDSLITGVLASNIAIMLIFPRRYAVFFVVFLITYIILYNGNGRDDGRQKSTTAT